MKIKIDPVNTDYPLDFDYVLNNEGMYRTNANLTRKDTCIISNGANNLLIVNPYDNCIFSIPQDEFGLWEDDNFKKVRGTVTLKFE